MASKPSSINLKSFRIYGNGGLMLPEFNQDFRYAALQRNYAYKLSVRKMENGTKMTMHFSTLKGIRMDFMKIFTT